MNYFVIQLITGKEETFLKHAKSSEISSCINFFWLRRELIIKKLGIKRKTISSMFPGYIFIKAETIPYSIVKEMQKLPGFVRFLKNNNEIFPLADEDKRLINKLYAGGEIAGLSKVYFDANDKIIVVSGPMKGLEGYIIKVDRRKKRAKIKLKLYENSFPIDFGFELIEHSEGK